MRLGLGRTGAGAETERCLMSADARRAWAKRRVEELTGERLVAAPRIYDDTTKFMYIDRGDVIHLQGELFLVRGHEREGRFGIDEQPKFWVKRAWTLQDGRIVVLKLRCEETFKIHVGPMEFACARSAEKEARLLERVRGDRRFMQGRSLRDSRGNLIRVLDFIEGTNLIDYLSTVKMPHERYFDEAFPRVFAKTVVAFRAVQFLDAEGLCHGDIRNDHILVERATGSFRWIDFDLTQSCAGYDLWTLGNVLHFVVAKGFVSFREILGTHPELIHRLVAEDASVFFPYRVMNLGKIFPYIPAGLKEVLKRFSVGASAFYDSIEQVVEDLAECALAMGWPLEEAAS